MKGAFISNYFNHHQKALCDALYNECNSEFYFLQTVKMSAERKKGGWGGNVLPDYVKDLSDKSAVENIKEYSELICECDFVVIGSADKRYINKRIRQNKAVFIYSERIAKPDINKIKLMLRIYKHFVRYSRKNVRVLCSSAYTSLDLKKWKCFDGRCYKWGYFPSTVEYQNIDTLINKKEENTLIWVARYLELKHPELPVLIVDKLKENGYKFKLEMIGNGVLLDKTKKIVKEKHLEDVITFIPVLTPEQVREHMEKSSVFLFTSDFNEGWGAVLNEAMNSGCCCIVSHAIGSAPYLIKDGVNGFLYKNGDIDELYNKVSHLLDNPEECAVIGKRAYETISTEWNAQTAAMRLINLVENPDIIYDDGPCSKAEIIENDWYGRR
jgi:glycosyltransferase involved in cell wall biosynthesis